jgi:3-deoxy-D-arabino-heptulosonate 7-phosphate (DAHP) synthase class II
LRLWSRSLIPQGKIALAVCREVVEQLEKAQEGRQLTKGERNLIKTLKMRILGIAAIEKSRAKQKSRLTWIRKGDANTKYFHLMANIRKKKNFIHALQSENGVVVTQRDKHEVIYNTHELMFLGHAP